MSAPLDPRARRSRTALEAALRELLSERRLTQISISDVTKRADVNRSTFYEHYTDLADLAASACTTVFEELVATSSLSRPGRTVANPLPRLFAHVADHAHLYRTLLGPDGSARVINHLLRRIGAAAHEGRGATDTPHDPTAVFLAGAVLGVVIDWLRRDCPGTPDEIGNAYWPHLIAAATADHDCSGQRSG